MSKNQYEAFITQSIGNILSNKIGVLVVLSLGNTPEGFRKKYSKLVDPELVDNLMRFIDYTGSNINKKYVISMADGRESTIDRLNKEISELKKYNRSIVYYLALSTIEKYRGPVAILETVERINNIINDKDIGIAVAKAGVEMEKQIKNIASVHINLVNIYNKLCLYCNAPKTVLYAIEPSENYIFDLVPIV